MGILRTLTCSNQINVLASYPGVRLGTRLINVHTCIIHVHVVFPSLNVSTEVLF